MKSCRVSRTGCVLMLTARCRRSIISELVARANIIGKRKAAPGGSGLTLCVPPNAAGFHCCTTTVPLFASLRQERLAYRLHRPQSIARIAPPMSVRQIGRRETFHVVTVGALSISYCLNDGRDLLRQPAVAP